VRAHARCRNASVRVAARGASWLRPAAMSKTTARSREDCERWVQRVHEAQSRHMTPEAREELMRRVAISQRQESCMHKCRAAKSHALRSHALAAEGLRQMAACSAPEQCTEVQSRWTTAQAASESRQVRALQALDAAPQAAPIGGTVSLIREAQAEDEEALAEVAELVGAEDNSMLAVVAFGGGEGGAGRTVKELLKQLRVEPADTEECAAKFALYEGYASEVEKMRGNVEKFRKECASTVPPAVATEMAQQVKGIDSDEAMGIPDGTREWFVYHMMCQAERNNGMMSGVLDSFEKKMEFLSTNEQSECPVCLDPFEESGDRAPEVLGCCHKVCKECWESWVTITNNHAFCPMCRHPEFVDEMARRAQAL